MTKIIAKQLKSNLNICSSIISCRCHNYSISLIASSSLRPTYLILQTNIMSCDIAVILLMPGDHYVRSLISKVSNGSPTDETSYFWGLNETFKARDEPTCPHLMQATCLHSIVLESAQLLFSVTFALAVVESRAATSSTHIGHDLVFLVF